jgi:hypothetical protein
MKLPRINKGPEIKLPKLSALKPRKRSGDDAHAEPEAATEARPADAQPAARRRASLPQPPAFVQDVYRDLRDRHLLLPAVALLAGIVAIPVLMKASPEPAPAIPPRAVPEDAAAVAPAVLAEQELGVRDYRKRLAELKRKNPFDAKQQYSDREIAEQTAISEPADPGAGRSGNGGDDGASGPPTDVQVEPSGPVQPSPGGDERPGLEVIEPLVDVRFGPVGEQRDYDGLKAMKALPRRKRAIVIFAGFAETSDRVVFMVNEAVVGTRGDGRCVPSARDCQFLSLKEGDARVLDFRHPDGSVTKYRLKLRKIQIEVTRDPKLERSLER